MNPITTTAPPAHTHDILIAGWLDDGKKSQKLMRKLFIDIHPPYYTYRRIKQFSRASIYNSNINTPPTPLNQKLLANIKKEE